MRQYVLDTETTGLSYAQGHKLIEIGCIEYQDRKPTRRFFHCYVNPDFPIDPGATKIHGITNDDLIKEKTFSQVADGLIDFIKGGELIIHNAAFDVGFINNELALSGKNVTLESICTITDTLKMAKILHPGSKVNLDALCRRYNIDNSDRVFHGALIDCEMLADVYLAMTGGQKDLVLAVEPTKASAREQGNAMASREDPSARPSRSVRIIRASVEEMAHHAAYCERNNHALAF